MKKVKKIISRGLMFLCCIPLVFSLACGKKTITAGPFPLADDDYSEEESLHDLLERARTLQWKGEYDEAYACYERAVQMSPKDVSLYFERGSLSFLILASLVGDSSMLPEWRKKLEPYDVSLLAEHHCILALHDFNEAIALDPNIDVFYYMRGSLQLFEMRPCYNTAAAIEDFNKAIQLNNSNAVYYLERGKAYISLGRYKQGADDLRKAAAIKEHDYQFYYDIGRLYEKMGMKKEAISFYKQAMEQAPSDRMEAMNSSLISLRGSKSEDLLHDYTELIAKRPEIAKFYAMRGHCYRESGQFSEAIKDYSVVVGFQPDNKEIYMERGRLFDYLDRKEEGRRDFQTACKLGYAKACAALGTETAAAARDTKTEISKGDIFRNSFSASVADTKADTLKGRDIPADTKIREAAPPKTARPAETVRDQRAETPGNARVRIEIVEAGELKDAKPARIVRSAGNNAPRPDPLDRWVPFWHSENDHSWYFYNVIKKTEDNHMVRVRVEQDDPSREPYKGELGDRKIDKSKPYVLEFWSFDCHLPDARMMGRYSPDSQPVISRSPYTNARQGVTSAPPTIMLDELWKAVCGETKKAPANFTP